MKRLVYYPLLLLIALAGVGLAYAQQQPKEYKPGETVFKREKKEPEQQLPYTREEYDAMEAIRKTADPSERAKLIDSFYATWPESKLDNYVRPVAFATYRQLGQIDKAIAHGEKLLQQQQDPVLMSILAAMYLGKQQSQRAQDMAGKALNLFSTMARPQHLSDQQWSQVKQEHTLMNYRTLGAVAFQARNYDEAISWFNKAVAIAPKDDYSWFHIGASYVERNRAGEAMKALAHAAAASGPYAKPARDLLGKVYRAVNKKNLENTSEEEVNRQIEDLIKKSVAN